jgi:hypothetical protein
LHLLFSSVSLRPPALCPLPLQRRPALPLRQHVRLRLLREVGFRLVAR